MDDRRFVQRVLEACLRRPHRRQDAPAQDVPLFVPPGHFYSPVVDPQELRRLPFAETVAGDTFEGLNIADSVMAETFSRVIGHYPLLDFPEEPASSHRYYYNNDFFSYGDAIMLACMIRERRPRRIIEVGSGFSSAVMLDTIERAPDLDTHCTFIEPNADRLKSLLRPSDYHRAVIHEQPVQTVPFALFEELQDGDILFLDTSHIAKTGSDVIHEVFHILPRLAPGVLIHFHDFFENFEYSEQWIFEDNRSWNEQYLLRAFLMYNDIFQIIFLSRRFYSQRPEMLDAAPLIRKNPGGALWLRKALT